MGNTMKREIPFLNRTQIISKFNGATVFVYYNLHKHTWSVRCAKSGLVLCHTNDINLKDCEFKVSEKGRQRVIETKQKNVHAGVNGIVSSEDFKGETQVTYNPYMNGFFFEVSTGSPVLKASSVRMISKKVWV